MENQIILIRHAKVDIDNSEKIDSLSLSTWVNDYNTAPIDANNLPSDETLSFAYNADVVLTSTLRRTIDSADVLGVKIYEKNSLFNEAGIPKINIPFLKFKPKNWLVILRVLLLLGLGKTDTSLKATKVQAEEAVQRLIILTENNKNVVLVGHGGMNWLIRKSLMKKGWVLDGSPSNSNWGATVLKHT